MPAVRYFDELRHAVVALLSLVGGIGDGTRHLVIHFARDDKHGPTGGIPWQRKILVNGHSPSPTESRLPSKVQPALNLEDSSALDTLVNPS